LAALRVLHDSRLAGLHRITASARLLPMAAWTDEVTAVATAVLALGVLGALVAAIFAGQQVREARRSREAHMAAEFFRRWDEDPLVEARRMIAGFGDAEALASAFKRYVDANAPEAFVLYRELDYFEQLAALERGGAFDIETIELLVGRMLPERWALWEPALRATHGVDAYPLFRALAARMRG
jgi:hypothetical protein